MSNYDATGTASTRRAFLGKTAAALTASTLLSSAGCSSTMKRLSGSARSPFTDKGDVILFQGDSITDAGRNRAREGNANDRSALGGGYAFLIAAQLLAARRDPELKIYNRGISGNKVFQLADRWDKDCLELRPNVLSILIGVNDI